jgi:hypothetical protein
MFTDIATCNTINASFVEYLEDKPERSSVGMQQADSRLCVCQSNTL